MSPSARFTNIRLVFSLALFILVFASCKSRHGHTVFRAEEVDVGSVRFAMNMYKFIQAEIFERNTVRDSELPDLQINDSLPRSWRNRFPPYVIEKELIIKFRLTNSSDSTEQMYFYPGAYVSCIRLLKLSDSSRSLQEISPDSTPQKWRLGFRLFSLQPKETTTYYGRLNVLRTTATLFYPQVLQKDFIDPFMDARIQGRQKTTMVTYIVTGIMLMMIFYSLAVYARNGGKEFLYYCGYAFCMGLLLFLKSFLLYRFSTFNFFFESYWDFLVQCLGVGFYFLFIRNFLDTRTNHPFLEKTFLLSEWLIGGLLAVYTILYFFTDNFVLLDFFENFTKQILLIIGLVFVVYGIRKHNRLISYLVLGNIFLILFSIISFLLIVTPLRVTNNVSLSPVLNDALLYYEIGLVLELIMFLSGLAYKNRQIIIEQTRESERLKIENERNEMEKQMA